MGCTVDTLTLSIQQKILAEQRVAEAGLSDKVRVHFLDYRNLPPEFEKAFDAFISVEMLEVCHCTKAIQYLDLIPCSGRRGCVHAPVLQDPGLGTQVRPRYRGHDCYFATRVTMDNVPVSPVACA